MKILVRLTAVISLFIISGCLDSIEETTINEDGSGIYSSTADMSKMFTMLAAMGGGDNEKMKDLEKLATDTIMSLAAMADSSENKLTAEERKLIENGTARLVMNYKEEKFTATFSIPFSKPADILAINSLLKSSKGDVFSKQLKKALPGDDKGNEDMDIMGGDDGGQPDISDYFDFTYENSKLKKKLNKEHYAKVNDDKGLQSLMEMAAMGMTVNFKTVINLPRAVKKAEGKGITLSEDRKTVMIVGSLDDFMEDASKFEYEIEY